MAQSVKHPTSAQVTISWFMSSSPMSGSVLKAQNLDPAWDSVSPSLSALPPFMLCLSVSLKNETLKKKIKNRGACVAQSVKCWTAAQVMISWFVGSSPALGSVLAAQSLDPASDSVSPSLSALPPFMLCLSVSLKNE